MNLTRIMYCLTVGEKKFLKQIFVQIIPQVGSYLKVANHSFVVDQFEQDLDAYTGDRDYEHGMSCESVRATLNVACYEDRDYPKIIEDLIQDSWIPAKIS